MVIGTGLGARFFVPQGSGMAGPAIALGYGVIGVAVGLLVGLLLVRWWSVSSLRRVVLVLTVLAAGVLVWLTIRYRAAQRDADRQQEASAAKLSPFQRPYAVRLEVQEAGRVHPQYGLPLRRIDVANDSTEAEVTWITGEGERCAGLLVGLERMDLSEALQRTAPAVTLTVCARDTTAQLLHTLSWRSEIVPASIRQGSLRLSGPCLAQSEGARDLIAVLQAVYARTAGEAACEPADGAPR